MSKTFSVEHRQLSELVPYWRNPRVITDEAVNAVAESIRRYGYQQPIVVDSSNVIVMGHTRYQALRRLDISGAVPVRVVTDLSAEQVKQLRALDNRVAEYSEWDWDKLSEELEELGSQANLAAFFRELDQAEHDLEASETHDSELEVSTETQEAQTSTEGQAEFICPGCFHSWETKVTKAAIRAGRIGANA